MPEFGTPQTAEHTTDVNEILQVANSRELEQLLRNKKVVGVSHERYTDKFTDAKNPSTLANYHFCTINLEGDEKIFVLVKPHQLTSMTRLHAADEPDAREPETLFAHYNGSDLVTVTDSEGTNEYRVDTQSLGTLEQQWRRAMPPYRIGGENTPTEGASPVEQKTKTSFAALRSKLATLLRR